MFKLLVSLTIFLLASPAFGQNQVAADHLAAAFNNTRSISFYFLSQTDDYSLSATQLKAASTIRIYRACGRDCENYMRDVVVHLKQAVPLKCRSGQQNVLIETGSGVKVLYSYSGRLIEFEGNCYFNQKSVDEILSRPCKIHSAAKAQPNGADDRTKSTG
ncbi:MAG: hypothetical protein JSR34_10470 [Proteobacteria bacterium]|nr:hypothetical protein [Pseudomonadota bacterium]